MKRWGLRVMNYDDVIEVRLYNPTPWEIIQEIKLKKLLGYYLVDTEWVSDEKYKILVILKFELLKESKRIWQRKKLLKRFMLFIIVIHSFAWGLYQKYAGTLESQKALYGLMEMKGIKMVIHTCL